MPSISTFQGITVYMYYLSKEHHPPHIHVYYNNYNAIISISEGKVIDGKFPKKKLKLVQQWILIHKNELQTMWSTQEFKKLLPLNEGEMYVS